VHGKQSKHVDAWSFAESTGGLSFDTNLLASTSVQSHFKI